MSSQTTARDLVYGSYDKLIEFGFDKNNKIGCIKALRAVIPGLGLAESKTHIENLMASHQYESGFYNAIQLLIKKELHIAPNEPRLSHEQLIGELDMAIVAGEAFYMDPIESVLKYIEKMEQKGGTDYIAQKIENFMDML